jgi:hypothetical protein
VVSAWFPVDIDGGVPGGVHGATGGGVGLKRPSLDRAPLPPPIRPTPMAVSGCTMSAASRGGHDGRRSTSPRILATDA